MPERCILCGRKYKRKVSDAHLKSHKISSRRYKTAKEHLTEAQWNYYWKNEKVQAIFPDPLAELDEPVKGFSSYLAWVQDRKPELSE